MHDFSVLITVALPSSGPQLLRVAQLLAEPKHLRVTALHCWTDSEGDSEGRNPSDEISETMPLEPLLRAVEDVAVDPIYSEGSHVEDSILDAAGEHSADLILMGWHRPMVHDEESPGPIVGVLEHAKSDVAVFLARQSRPIRRVLVPFYGGMHDRRALELAARVARSAQVEVTVLHVIAPDRADATSGTGLTHVVEDISDGRVRLKVVEDVDPVNAAVREAWTGYDLIMAGASEIWGVDFSLFSEQLQRLAFATPASLLVVHACSPQRSSEASERSSRRGKSTHPTSSAMEHSGDERTGSRWARSSTPPTAP